MCAPTVVPVSREDSSLSGSFEGDLIRPLGLVTLYFAYAEYEIDLLLLDLFCIEPIGKSQRSWNVGSKLSRARGILRRLEAARLDELAQALVDARLLFERRNQLVHGCILAGGRVLSARPDVQETRTSAEELADLAERIFNCKERISAHRQRDLGPLVAKRCAASSENKLRPTDA